MVKNALAWIRLLIKNFTWFLFVSLLGIAFSAKSQQYNLHQFSDGLAQPYVYSIIQDNKGYLWIGTGNGLSRFDGISFKTFTTRDSLADNFITCSFKNEKDLWFGHMNGNITHYNGKIFNRITGLNQKSGITDIEKSPKGEIWASTNSNGLIRLKGTTNLEQTAGESSQISIRTFQFLTENEILTGSVEGVDYCSFSESGKVKLIRHINEIPDSKIQSVIKMRNGSGFYIATDNDGIFQLVPEGKQFKVLKIDLGLNHPLTGLQSIFEDSKMNLWLSTFGSGLIKLSPSSPGKFIVNATFNTSSGFAANDVKVAYEDREGSIWSGNYGSGLTQITVKSFIMHSFDKNLYGTEIYSIYIRNNFRWLGTDKGLLKLNQSTGEILKFYSAKYNLPKDKITALFSDHDNELWIGTENNGVYRMTVDKEKIIPFRIGNGNLENSITGITGRHKQIWIGTKKGVCNINTGTGNNRWYTMENGELPHNYVQHLFIDSKGTLWFSTLSNTLVFIRDGKVERETISSENGISTLGPITGENDSIIWVGSNGNGVFEVKPGSVINLTTKENLFSDYCYSLLMDNNRNLWVGHRGGLSKIRTTDLFVKPIEQSAGINKSCEFNPNAVFKDDNNKLWFGTNEGLLGYDPASEIQESVPPVLNIISCKVNDEDIDFNEKLTLPPGNYKIKIEFLSISLKEPTLVNYVYQLDGYDNSPVDTKTSNVIFPHLTDGDYTFRLWAISADGVMTKTPVTLQIVIKKPLWKQAWFVISIFLLLVFSVLFYIRRRDNKHLAEKRILETKVQERTLEISAKNTQLEEKQEKIIAQNTELEKYRNYLEDIVDERTKELLIAKNKAEESDRLKSSFLNNISHEIRTPLNIISGFTTLLEDDDLEETEKKKYINTINNNTESLVSILSEILDVSKIEAGQFELDNTRFKPDDVLNDLENHFLHNNRKHIEFINKSPKDGLELYCDKDRLHQVLNNLLSNAFKFTETGSVKFGYTVFRDSVRFFVSDTGIGMNATEMEKIFDPFYKIEENIDILYGGAGIGLTTAKRLVELMGGTISVESKVNEGSVFYFTLPVRNENPVSGNPGEMKISKKGFLKNKTILVATDEQDTFDLVSQTLHCYKVKILQAVNITESLKLIQNTSANENYIVILDTKTPDKKDYEIYKKIKKISSKIPVIALTAFQLNTEEQITEDEYFDGYISKPIKAETLINELFQSINKNQ